MKNVDVKIYDSVIPDSVRQEVWKYINKQKWYATWKVVRPYMTSYIPEEEGFMDDSHKIMSLRLPTMWMHRTCFASDESSLEKNHPVIWELWQRINLALGNKYTITGCPEDMALWPEDHQDWKAPSTQDPNLEQGWRVYTNGQLDESVKRSHGVHRDTVDETDDQTRTILYVANLEWYPTWFSEIVFYPDDPAGLTGDRQQFQGQHKLGQERGFKIGWADEGKIVSSVPGRIIDYDGRTLHTTRPAAIWSRDIRKTIAFRVRLKN